MTKQQLVVCVADIEGFAQATRHMSLDLLVEFLQGFYERVGAVLLAHNGRLVKYIGDAVLMTFEHGGEETAVRAVWALRETYREYVAALIPDVQATDLCAGIAAGEVAAGQIGHPQMLGFDVLGRPVTYAFALLGCRGIAIDQGMFEILADRLTAEPAQAPGGVRGFRVTALR
jgi:adenylate cyclase